MVGVVEPWGPDHIATGSRRSGKPTQEGQWGGEDGGDPPSLFSGAKEKLASLWHGWRDVLGTDKALTVLNPLAQLLVTAKVPRVTSLMSFGGAAASVSHGDVHRETK